MKQFDQGEKQLWVSEGGWGENPSYLPNADAQAVFLAQFYLLPMESRDISI